MNPLIRIWRFLAGSRILVWSLYYLYTLMSICLFFLVSVFVSIFFSLYIFSSFLFLQYFFWIFVISKGFVRLIQILFFLQHRFFYVLYFRRKNTKRKLNKENTPYNFDKKSIIFQQYARTIKFPKLPYFVLNSFLQRLKNRLKEKEIFNYIIRFDLCCVRDITSSFSHCFCL